MPVCLEILEIFVIKEIVCRKQVSSELNLSLFFEHPSNSWERGFDKNRNGRIRQYFKK